MAIIVPPLWEAFVADRSPAAKRALVVQYLDLIRYVVARLGRVSAVAGRALEQEDLLQYGVLGLMNAIDRFSPAAGVKFETYAIPRIRGAILDEVRNLDWVPRSVRANARRIEHAAERVVQEVGREAAEQEIAGKLEISIEEFQKILKDAGAVMTSARQGRHETAEPMDQVAEASPDPYQRLSDEESRTKLVEAIVDLPERSRKVIALYYYEGLKFGDIARLLKVSESRVSQIHSEVLRGLRTRLAGLV
jgi:RNA polymerase sigma factor for flagellar operon FliA